MMMVWGGRRPPQAKRAPVLSRSDSMDSDERDRSADCARQAQRGLDRRIPGPCGAALGPA
jgi:hypothetical protein